MRLAADQSPGTWESRLAHIAEVTRETSDVTTYRFEIRETGQTNSEFEFSPGQFNMVYLPGFGESALSLSSDADQHASFTHTVRRVGNMTSALARLTVGGQVGIRGPFGTSWPIEACQGRHVVVACGGLGIAPLRSVIYHFVQNRQRFGRIALIYGARTPADLVYEREFREWQDADVEMIVTVDRESPGWNGVVGVVPGQIDELDADFDDAVALVCGPEIMMRYSIREFLERGTPPDQIHVSMERNMSCGIGFCGHCQIGPVLLCRDGPVLCYNSIRPLLNLEDL